MSEDVEVPDTVTYWGMCHGGPLEGKEAVSRFPKGFLLVDKATNRCWIYDYDKEQHTFSARQEEPMEVQTEGEKNRYRAALEPNYDVLAGPWGDEYGH